MITDTQQMDTELPLQCSYPSAIDFDGLDVTDQCCISQIGFDGWLDEVAKQDAYRQLTSQEVLDIKPTETTKLREMVTRLNENWYTSPKKPDKFYDRAVHKLAWFLKAGYVLVTPQSDATTSLGLFSEVTNHEMQMSDREFYANWSDEGARSHKRIRIEKGLIPDDSGIFIVKKKRAARKTVTLICIKCDETFEAAHRGTKKCAKCGGPPDPTKRYCALGEGCLRSVKGQPQECLTRSDYCSDVCLGAHQAAIQRSRQVEVQFAV